MAGSPTISSTAKIPHILLSSKIFVPSLILLVPQIARKIFQSRRAVNLSGKPPKPNLSTLQGREKIRTHNAIERNTMSTCLSEISEIEKSTLVDLVFKRILERNHEAWKPTPAQLDACYRDIHFHVDHIAVAARYNSRELFDAYLQWLQNYLVPNICSQESLGASFQDIRNGLEQSLSHIENIGTATDLCNRASDFFQAGHQGSHQETPRLQGVALQFLNALLKNDRENAMEIVKSELNSGSTIQSIYENIFEKSQHEVGLLWQEKKISVVQEHYCTAATQYCMSMLYSKIFDAPQNGHTFVGCCVSNDLHELGMRMISDFFALEGFNSIYLGASCPTDAILDSLQKHKPKVVGISVALNNHILAAEKLIHKIRTEMKSRPIILVGGRPFFHAPHLFKTIGADHTAHSAAQAVEVVKQALQTSPHFIH
jgi:methanogenic corrinoid protein MtbC1